MTTRMSKEAREQFLAQPRVGVVGISEEGRGPLTVPVWYWYQPGGDLWFETEPVSRKGSLLHIGKRISLCVQDDKPPYAYVSVEGPIVDIAEDDRQRHELPMAIRYLGEAEGPRFIENLPPSEWKRYILRPERWLSFDGSETG
jgi:uncharacterized protein